jgi:hypothetical protein
MDQPLPSESEKPSCPPGTRSSRLAVLVSVHRSVGSGLTTEVENLLKYNPQKVFFLRDVLNNVRDGALAGEVNSILHKLVNAKGRVILGRKHNGHRLANTYKWRLPSDPGK